MGLQDRDWFWKEHERKARRYSAAEHLPRTNSPGASTIVRWVIAVVAVLVLVDVWRRGFSVSLQGLIAWWMWRR